MQQFNDIARNNFNRLVAIHTDTIDNIDTSKIELSTEKLKLCTIDDAFASLRNQPERINTGILGLDEMFGEYVNGEYKTGFRLKDIIILAGMSGIGKTSVAFSVFTNFYKQKRPVIFFSLDMRKEKTWDCFRKCLSGTNRTDAEFADELILRAQLPKIVTHEGTITMQQLDKFVTDNPAEVVFIDYIDYLQPTKKGNTDAENFKNLFLELKKFVEKHNCAIILLSQSTEDKSYRQGRPSLINLYGGKAVRSAVDHVISVYRNSKHNENLPAEYKSVSELHGLKLRSDSTNSTAYVKYYNGNIVHMYEDEVTKYKTSLTGGNK